jgi:hypothetical protein
MTRAVLVLPLLAACAPQNVSLESGDFTAYLSDVASITVRKGKIELNDFERHTAVDCRNFEAARNEAQNEELRLGGEDDGFDRLQICDGDRGVDPGAWPPIQEEWLDFDGFHVVGEDLDVWRGEGIINSEGDVQIGFHHLMPGGVDLRFAFVVDPAFQPKQCVQTENGEGVELVDIDGNWIEQWSEDTEEEGDTLVYLNAGSYQFNPIAVEDYNPNDANTNLDLWFIPEEWQAGYAEAHLGDDRFIMRTTRYAAPKSYLSFETADSGASGAAQVTVRDLYFEDYCGSDCADNARADANDVMTELTLAGLPEREDLPTHKPQVHANNWREFDGQPGGLDGWSELNYNWVRFDAGSSFEKGGEASGEFSLVMDATESASRLFLRGRFEVKRWKKDVWTTAYLPPIKFEEYGTSLCGTAPEDVAELF